MILKNKMKEITLTELITRNRIRREQKELLDKLTESALQGLVTGANKITNQALEYYAERALYIAKQTLKLLNDEHNIIDNEG